MCISLLIIKRFVWPVVLSLSHVKLMDQGDWLRIPEHFNKALCVPLCC